MIVLRTGVSRNTDKLVLNSLCDETSCGGCMAGVPKVNIFVAISVVCVLFEFQFSPRSTLTSVSSKVEILHVLFSNF